MKAARVVSRCSIAAVGLYPAAGSSLAKAVDLSAARGHTTQPGRVIHEPDGLTATGVSDDGSRGAITRSRLLRPDSSLECFSGIQRTASRSSTRP